MRTIGQVVFAFGIGLVFAMPLDAAAVETAQSRPPAGAAADDQDDEREKKRDYSHEAIRRLFAEGGEAAGKAKGVEWNFGSVEMNFASTRVRLFWLPLAPLPGTEANVSPMPMLDPMQLAGVSIPWDGSSWRDRFRRWRFERHLRATTAH